MADVDPDTELTESEQIDGALSEIAQSQMGKLVIRRVREQLRRLLVGDLELSCNPSSADSAAELHRSISASFKKVSERVSGELTVERIRALVEKESESLREALNGDEWRARFPGRDILRAFTGRYVNGMRYEQFRNMLIGYMARSPYRPTGMKKVLDAILND